MHIFFLVTIAEVQVSMDGFSVPKIVSLYNSGQRENLPLHPINTVDWITVFLDGS